MYCPHNSGQFKTDNIVLLNEQDNSTLEFKQWTDNSKTESALLAEGYVRQETYNDNDKLYVLLENDCLITADLSNHLFTQTVLNADLLASVGANVDSLGSTGDFDKELMRQIIDEIITAIQAVEIAKANLLYKQFTALRAKFRAVKKKFDDFKMQHPIESDLIALLIASLAKLDAFLGAYGAGEDIVEANAVKNILLNLAKLTRSKREYVYSKPCAVEEFEALVGAIKAGTFVLVAAVGLILFEIGSVLVSLGILITTLVGGPEAVPAIESAISFIYSSVMVPCSHALREALRSVDIDTRNKAGDFNEALARCNGPQPDPPYPPPRKDDHHIDPDEDPSGYVCEAVDSNRLEGVTTTLYYSENADGSDAEMWDAEDFGQQNPLITDAAGQYQWYVPTGYWQVKYEKDGYETIYSDWLPVPPPQLDVNVAMVSTEAPTVESVKVYRDSIDIFFSQYMDLTTVNTDNLVVTVGGKKVSGRVIAANSEKSFKDSSVMYASKFSFVPNRPFSTDMVTVSISGVRNYASSGMERFSSEYTPEYRVTSITAPNEITVDYGEPASVSVKLGPDNAAAGKTVLLTTENSELISVDKASAVTDENGVATFTVDALLPGTAKLIFTVDGTVMTASTVVNCTNDRPAEKLDKVVPSIVSGSGVKKGTKLVLTNSNPDAKIYYTFDMTCPCHLDNPSRTLYTGPIEITEDTTNIAAYAVLDGYEESNPVLFTYVIITDTLLGDSDDDAEVTILDATAIQRFLAGLATNQNIGKMV